MQIKVQRQKAKRQIERGKERTANNNQSNHQQHRHSYFIIKHPFCYKICTSVFVLEHSILKQDHAAGGEAALARVPCYHSYRTAEHSVRWRQKGLGNKRCTRFDMGNIMPGCRYTKPESNSICKYFSFMVPLTLPFKVFFILASKFILGH